MKTKMLDVSRFLREHTSWLAIVVVQFAMLLILMAYCSTARAQSNTASGAAASSAPFHLYDAIQGQGENERVMDLPDEFTGIVIAVWNADTAPNRRACQSRWLFKQATEKLCASLPRHKILSVRTDAGRASVVAYVAVSKTQRVAVEERVRVRRAKQDADGAIVAMPVLTAVYPPATRDSGSLTSR